ncbi:MAG: LuxR C-terminal-related transcriptional regulator [Holosporaceae bacterium]|jgi:tetratricopeptide (TPR) repeat protein/DNA-binding CsgD family transcriptional regulator|nr:LuxR C-terminal-related transcriptional regulator [Holosporaceae bacterium]
MESGNQNSDHAHESIAGIAFSPKEMSLIRELVTGESYKVIASRLSMSDRNVQYHVKNIMNKIGCNAKSDLMTFFNVNGIFPDDRYQRYEKKKSLLKKAMVRSAIIVGVAAVLAIFYFHGQNRNIAVMDIPRFHENFLRRGKLLEKITEILQSQSEIKTVVIIGAGGAGKTSLAREILCSSECTVKWEINAETAVSIYNSFFDLARHLAITEKSQKELENIKDSANADEKRKRLMKLISRLLKESGNWCLLFDNVNEMRRVTPYLPQSTQYWGKGNVIITTRNEDIRNTGYAKSSWIVDVGFLSEFEQTKLFCDILYGTEFEKLDKNLQSHLKKFLSNIPRMPLDVCAAAYYLKNTEISLEDYEKIMETSGKDLSDVQGVLLEENVNYSRTRYSIISSVFEEILKENPQFKSLLLFMCLLDSQNIPKSLMKTCADSVTVDKFIHNLRKNSLTVGGKDDFSIHRSSQSIGLDYILGVLTAEEKKQILENLISVVTPYEKLETLPYDLAKLTPHLEAFLHKLSGSGFPDFLAGKSGIDLLITLGNIHLYRAYRPDDALHCFQKALELNKKYKCSDPTAVASINLKIGEIYTVMSADDEALFYLEKSLSSLRNNLTELAKNYRLIGITHMRKDRFREANKYFEKAIAVLEQEPIDSVLLRERKSDIYADTAFNYAMNGINRNDAPKAVAIMKKAAELLATAKVDPQSESYKRIRGRLAIHTARLAGIYNALGKYDSALQTVREAEDIIKKSGSVDTDIIYAQGIIARETGLSHLRLNKVKEAYDYFMQAKKIFSRAGVGAYLFRLKMHEAESLIRLNRPDEALKVCESAFSAPNRERNNYCDLFFNTCYYHAAVIKYRKNDFAASRKYFAQFFASMKTLCKNIIPPEKYDELAKLNAFQENPSDLKTCFENALHIFESVYRKDYEFTKYYVEENLKSVKEK